MIIAVDFDGILCKNQFPDIGEPNYTVITQIRQLLDLGCEVILWTSRADDRLTEAVEWCEERGLHFSAVNENAPSNIAQYINLYPNGTRKVYADYYIDDHNIEYRMATERRSEYNAMYNVNALLSRLIYKVKEEKLKWQEEE